MKISNELREFYQAYVEWLDNGAPDKLPFWRGIGLCSGVEDFNINLHSTLRKEIHMHFKSEKLSPAYPFGEKEYDRDQTNDTMHLDPNRIAWARKWAKEE